MTGCTDPTHTHHQLVVTQGLDDQTATRRVAAASQAAGCICTPRVDMPNRAARRAAHRAGKPAKILVRHENWCPLATRPTLN